MNPSHVKFESGGVTTYGVFRQWEKGRAIVDDAILPVSYKVSKKKLIEIPMGRWMRPVDFNDEAAPFVDDEYHRHVSAEFRKALDLNSSRVRERGPETVAPGRLLSVGVGDGSAWYVVTRANRKSATIEWRGFSADRWVDLRFGYGGSFPVYLVQVCMYVSRSAGRSAGGPRG